MAISPERFLLGGIGSIGPERCQSLRSLSIDSMVQREFAWQQDNRYKHQKEGWAPLAACRLPHLTRTSEKIVLQNSSSKCCDFISIRTYSHECLRFAWLIDRNSDSISTFE